MPVTFGQRKTHHSASGCERSVSRLILSAALCAESELDIKELRFATRSAKPEGCVPRSGRRQPNGGCAHLYAAKVIGQARQFAKLTDAFSASVREACPSNEDLAIRSTVRSTLNERYSTLRHLDRSDCCMDAALVQVRSTSQRSISHLPH